MYELKHYCCKEGFIMKKTIYIMVLIAMLLIPTTVAICTAEEDCERCHSDIVANFTTSLHHTGLGMYDEYEKGAAGHFDINMTDYYEKFDCAKCHAVSCTNCHPGSNMYESHLYEITIDTCEPCHGKKQTSTYVGDMPMHKSKGPNADVHYERGLDCTDCHAASELHGTGVKYDTQLEAVNVECEGCHKDVTESRSHIVHYDKLECISCHQGWTLTCQNCHLDTRKGMTVSSEEFLLGINKDGKVTNFMRMDATIGNETHTGYGEWHSHTITSEGKDCKFCHNDPVVLGDGLEGQIICEGGSLIPQETIDRILAADLTECNKRSFWSDLFSWWN
jgi:hypothetical protein